MRLYISPHPNTYYEDGQGSGGIWRVITAQAKHLPSYGVEIVDTAEDAEVLNVHAGAMTQESALSGKPMVASSHGLYWTGDFNWREEYWQYNASVIEVLRRAHAVITPSAWVAQPIARDLRKKPYVIPHGVDIEDFEPQEEHEGFVLWAKPRVDVVSNPAPMNGLARRAPGVRFVSTYGQPSNNVTIIGAKPYTKFIEIASRAMVWLATARETGDIGSREMMAMGIPVLGWDWGATAELVVHGETGYLAEPGNFNQLREGLAYCIEHRERLGAAGRELVRVRYRWKDLMGRYARVYEEALRDDVYLYKVSVVLPTYNYASFVTEALRSLEGQTLSRNDFEVIVIDDGSTDGTPEVLVNYAGESNLNIRIIRKENGGLCSALNAGHAEAVGRYIVNLDADNVLPPKALETLSIALDEKPWLDVVGGGLAMYREDGNHQPQRDWPWGTVSIDAQLDHYNQLHSSAMMRASSVKRLGGYRMRQYKNEDGEFWCRAMSAGLRFEQVTEEPTLVYRWHEGNKSKTEGGEDDPKGPLSWNYYYPWRERKGITPFATTNDPPNGSWAVRSYHDPHISVVIPCGPGHDKYLVDALDSIYGQTFRNFECVVANDTGAPLDVAAMGHPWVKVIDAPCKGPAIARNVAIAASHAPLIVPLDADDMLYPETLEMYYSAWLACPENLVYGDCFTEDSPGHRKKYYSGNWTWDLVRKRAIYQVTILYPKQWWEAVRGYDAGVPWEDWLFGVKLHIVGIGATYVKEPWGVYRHWTGSKADVDNADYGKPEWFDRMQSMYDWIDRKEGEMACKGCSKKARSRVISEPMRGEAKASGEEATIVYDGPREGSFFMNSRVVRGRKYMMQRGQPIRVAREDAEWIEKMVDYRTLTEGDMTPQLPSEPPEVPQLHVEWQSELGVEVAESMEPQEMELEMASQRTPPPQETPPQVSPEEPQEVSPEEVSPEEPPGVIVPNPNGLAFLLPYGIRTAMLDRIEASGFGTRDSLIAEIEFDGGQRLMRSVQRLGPVALAKIKTALEAT